MDQMNNILLTLSLYLSVRPSCLTHCGGGVRWELWRGFGVGALNKGQFGVSPLMNSESFFYQRFERLPLVAAHLI